MANEPVTRIERYLAYLNGDNAVVIPDPVTKVERYLYTLCKNGTGGASGVPVRIEKTAADTVVELEPNKLYIFPEMASLTYTLATPADATVANEYHFVFKSGATATQLVNPAGVETPDSFTIDANKIYEISILEGNLAYQSWEVTTDA